MKCTEGLELGEQFKRSGDEQEPEIPWSRDKRTLMWGCREVVGNNEARAELTKFMRLLQSQQRRGAETDKDRSGPRRTRIAWETLNIFIIFSFYNLSKFF